MLPFIPAYVQHVSFGRKRPAAQGCGRHGAFVWGGEYAGTVHKLAGGNAWRSACGAGETVETNIKLKQFKPDDKL